VFLSHDLPHAEKTFPPPSLPAILLLHLPFFAYHWHFFSRLTPFTLNFPILVLVQAADGAAEGATDGAADGAADGASDGAADGAANSAADSPHWPQHASKTRPPPSSSAIFLLHLPFCAHLSHVFFCLLPFSLKFPCLVFVQAADGAADGAGDSSRVTHTPHVFWQAFIFSFTSSVVSSQ